MRESSVVGAVGITAVGASVLASWAAWGLIACGCTAAPSIPPPTNDAGCAQGYEVVLDGGGEVPDPPNGAAACPKGACNYQTGAGCPEDTPSCLPVVTAGGVEPSCEQA